MPRPQLHPTDEQRKMVKSLAAFGLTQYQVAGIIGIRSPKTLRKYFRAELDLGDLEGYAKVQQTHFQMATDGEHWPATKAWQDSYHRRHGQSPQFVKLELPPIKTAADVVKAQDIVLQAVACGKLTPSDGHSYISMLGERRQAIDTEEHEARLAALESKAELGPQLVTRRRSS